MEDIQKVFVNKNNTTTIKCPECGDIRTVDVSKFKGNTHVLKAKCPCKAVFNVRLDFRKTYRKSVNFNGNIKSLKGNSGWISVRILNVSKGGIGLKIPAKIGLQVGDQFELKFALDDPHKTIIDRKVVVKLIEKCYVGCEFAEPAMHDQEKALGFFLMP
ncbi:MAG: PilZ domain-containing protein [Proteobacteria bacterium]|nr:PilZ domain-containing protein [Pseudomonadota bacterium]MBU1709570.1 PilZ domain-containing protein [Pseudomonadota bacterium]